MRLVLSLLTAVALSVGSACSSFLQYDIVGVPWVGQSTVVFYNRGDLPLYIVYLEPIEGLRDSYYLGAGETFSLYLPVGKHLLGIRKEVRAGRWHIRDTREVTIGAYGPDLCYLVDYYRGFAACP